MRTAERIAPHAAPDELALDRRCLCRILEAFEREQVASFRRDLLRLAIDLFDVHLQMQGPAAIDRERAVLLDLIDTIEATDPRSKLYFARGLEFKRHLERYLACDAAAAYAKPTRIDPRLQRLHLTLRERATTMLERFGQPRALAA